MLGRIADSLVVAKNYYFPSVKSPYKFMPIFFIAGACMEWVMIKVPAAGKGETFYDVWRRNQANRVYQEKLAKESRS